MASAGPEQKPRSSLAGERPPVAGYSSGDWVTVRARPIRPYAIISGAVQPIREVTLSAQTGGRIEYIGGQEGTWFSAGDLLASLNEDELLARRRAAMAELEQARIALRNSELQYEREYYAGESASGYPGMGAPYLFDYFITEPVADAVGISNLELERRTDLITAAGRIDQARAKVDRQLSLLAAIDTRLRDTRSTAPFDGVIARKFVEPGDTVQPGQPLLQIMDISRLQLKMEVPGRLMPGIRHGMILPVRLDMGRYTVQARVARIHPTADPDRHTVTVKLDLPAHTAATPGMYAEVHIPDVTAHTHRLPMIPATSWRWSGNLPNVYVINEDNQVEPRHVRVGERTQDMVQVLSGLKDGDRILRHPPHTG